MAVALKREVERRPEVQQYGGTARVLGIGAAFPLITSEPEEPSEDSSEGATDVDEPPETVGDPRDRAAAGRSAVQAPFLQLRLPGGDLVLSVTLQLPGGRFGLESGDGADFASVDKVTMRPRQHLSHEHRDVWVAPSAKQGGIGETRRHLRTGSHWRDKEALAKQGCV